MRASLERRARVLSLRRGLVVRQTEARSGDNDALETAGPGADPRRFAQKYSGSLVSKVSAAQRPMRLHPATEGSHIASRLSLDSKLHARIVRIAEKLEARAKEGSTLLPPETLFHLGPKDELLRNVRLGNISTRDWRTHVMGNRSSYVLQRWRKGLYGTGVPIEAMTYTQETVKRGKKPWLVMIVLRERYRQKEHVLGEMTYDEPVFIDWLKNNYRRLGFESYAALRKECIQNGSFDVGRTGMFDVNGPDSDEPMRADEGKGSLAVALAMRDWGIKIAYDDCIGGDNWYIRDRRAIEDILGAPEELLHLMTTDYYWKGRTAENGFYGIFSIPIQVLLDLPDVPEDTMLRMLAAIRDQTPRADADDGFDVAWIRPMWQAMAEIVERYIDCSRRGRLPQLRAILSAYHESVLMDPSGGVCAKLAPPPTRRLLKDLKALTLA
jgi:hypothetical protein